VPSKGYETIGLKPAILAKLQKNTDEYYPGMFLPSALIMLMNEIRRQYYSVGLHNIKVDFSGAYTSLTIRSDVKNWIFENYEVSKEEYDRKYKVNCFSKFASIFMLNMFESKTNSLNYSIKLRESEFLWLMDEYTKRKNEYKTKYGVQTFEHFADVFLKELLEKVNAAKRILTL
jgi:hypothetical protein